MKSGFFMTTFHRLSGRHQLLNTEQRNVPRQSARRIIRSFGAISPGSFAESVALLTFFVSAVCIRESFAQTPGCAPLPYPAISWWRGEGTASDQVGTNNGNLVGNAAFTPGQVGQGFLFDGSTGSAVTVGTATSLRLQDFTIEAWVQRASTTIASQSRGGGHIFGFGSGGYGFLVDDDGHVYLVQESSSSVGSSFVVTDTAWHHLAVTKSGTEVVFYLDGTSYPASPYAAIFGFTTSAAVGARGDNLANSFLGAVDEVTIYKRPLAASEILAIYNAGSAGKCTDSDPPSIAGQPADQSVTAGANATFTAQAAGSLPLAFQWQFHGTNLSGATNYVLTITNAQLALAGSYQVVITNAYGAVTSAVAMLDIQSPPVINNQPQSVSVVPGSSAQFVVGVSGTLPFFFQWLHNATNPVGADSYALIITNVQAPDTGNYTVVISNSLGSVTSAPAALGLNLPPTITNQPASQAVPAGSNPAFAVGVRGTGPFNYQWSFKGTNLAGVTNSGFALNNVQESNAGPYLVVVSNSFGAVTSAIATLTVTNPVCAPNSAGLVGWWQAEGSSVDAASGGAGLVLGSTTFVPGKVGQAFSFQGSHDAISITNAAPFQLQDLTIEAWTKRNSTTNASQTIGGGEIFSFGAGGYGFLIDDDGHCYLVKNDSSNVGSAFQVRDTNWHHLAVTKAGTNVTFYLDGVAYPAGPYGAVFVFSTLPAIGARGDRFNNSFLGAIDELAIFNRPLTSNEIQAIYYATSQGKCEYPLSWVEEPTSQTSTVGSNVLFSSLVSGRRPVYYQWYQNGAGINAATNANLSLAGVTFFQAGNYTLTASNASGSITSTNATLTVLPAPVLPNGGFEYGNAAGWVLTDIASPLTPLGVRGAGYNSGYGFFSTAPTEGNYCLTGGFDGNGPGRIRAAVDIVLPPGGPVTLSLSYRFAWDMQNYSGSTKPRIFAVTVEPYGGGVGLQTNVLLMANPGTANYDTGNLYASIDLTAFSGRGIRISFDCIIPESFTGPGFFQLDNVVLAIPPAPPLGIAKSGSNVVLSWPLAFSNFTAIEASNLLSPVSWTPLPTNLIVRGATNSSLTLPISAASRFYRLRSP